MPPTPRCADRVAAGDGRDAATHPSAVIDAHGTRHALREVMRLRLDQLDARGLDLLLGRADRRVVIGAVTDLQGQLVTGDGTFTLEQASLARGEIASLQLQFATTNVSSEAAVVLEDVHGRAQRDRERFGLQLRAGTATASRLVLRIGDHVIEGQVELAGARLRIDGPEGVVFAERVVLGDVSLALGAVRLRLDRVAGVHVAVGWGRDGLRIEAEGIEIATGGFELALPEPAPAETAAEARPEVAPEAAGEAIERAPRALPFSREDVLALLDGVAGDVNVDLGVDLTVPVIGRRRATHRFRIPIENGALDYRKLESDLSTLEDALLDFSVRDGGLVLERGIPFIATRGRGKPILRWDLDADDLALAEARRIRLAMLPRFTVVGEGSGDPSKPPRVALRQLEAREIDVRVQVQIGAPPARLPLRRIDELSAAGNVFHTPDAPPREGHVEARIAGVELGPMTLPIGRAESGQTRREIRIEQLGLELAEAIEVAFAGIRPRAARGTLRGLTITGLRLAPASSTSVLEPHPEARASDSM